MKLREFGSVFFLQLAAPLTVQCLNAETPYEARRCSCTAFDVRAFLPRLLESNELSKRALAALSL